MKLSDEFKVGVFATFSIAILIVGFNYLKGRDLFGNSIRLNAVYTNLDGLTEGNPVLYYGVQVGKVSYKNLDYKDTLLEITLGFTINPEIRIPVNSTAKIISSDILQSKAVEIIPAKDKGDYAKDGDFLNGQTALSLTDQLNDAINPIKANAERLIKKLTSAMDKIDLMLDDETKGNVKSTISNFQSSSQQLSSIIDKTSKELGGILDNFGHAANSVKDASFKLTKTVDNVNELTDSLKEAPIKSTIEDVQTAMASLRDIISSIEDGEGTMAKLINDPALYKELLAAIEEINKLAKDVQDHPKHYLAPLGKKNRKNWAESE